MCTQGTVDNQHNVFEDDKGHCQPWMRAKLEKAVAAAALKALIEVDMDIMKKPEALTYLAFPKKLQREPDAAITPRFLDLVSALQVWDKPTSYPCQCKDMQGNQIIGVEIETAR